MAGGSTERPSHGATETAFALRLRAWGGLLTAAALLLALTNVLFGLLFRRDPSSTADFLQVVAWSGEWLRGLNPYAPPHSDADYPPNALVALSPLATIAAGSAIALWTALHVMLTAVIGVMASRLVSFGRWALLFAALVVSLPPFRTVMQFSIASFAPALAGFLLADRYPRLAGAAIGISLIKPQIGGPFLLWAIAARRWKTVGMAIAVPAALFALYLVRALRAPQHVVREWLEAIGRGHNHPDLTGGEINLQPLLAWISMPPLGIQMLIATVLALGLLIIWQRRQDDFDLRFLAAACLLSLLSVRHLSYDLLLAIPALAFVWSRDGRGARLLAAGAFAVLIVSPPSLYRHYFEPRFITTPADALLVHAYRIVAMALFAFTLLSTSSRRRFDTI